MRMSIYINTEYVSVYLANGWSGKGETFGRREWAWTVISSLSEFVSKLCHLIDRWPWTSIQPLRVHALPNVLFCNLGIWIRQRILSALCPDSLGLFFSFFLMWTVFKIFIEFVIILLLFYVLVFWARGMWDWSSLTRNQTCTPCIGWQNFNHWATREVPLWVLFIVSAHVHTQSLSPVGTHFMPLNFPGTSGPSRLHVEIIPWPLLPHLGLSFWELSLRCYSLHMLWRDETSGVWHREGSQPHLVYTHQSVYTNNFTTTPERCEWSVIFFIVWTHP